MPKFLSGLKFMKVYFKILLFAQICIAQDLFDPYNVHEIDIHFYNPNYNEVLENYWEENIKTYELARVIFNGDTLDSVGVRYKGNSTYYETHQVGSVKYPLNIDFDLIYEDQELLGYNKLKLSNSIFDPTFVKETMGYITQGYYLPTPEVGYATVKINGEYLGLYILVESINKPYLNKHFGNNEGAFFKCEPQFQFGEWYDAWPNLVWYGNDSMIYQYQMGYELKSDHGWEDLLSLIETLNYDTENIEDILNVDRALWFFASSIVMPDLDTYNGVFVHNYYLYKNTNTGKFEIIPWDKDNTFGGFLVNFLIDWFNGDASWIYNWDPFASENDSQRPLFSKLMDNPLYKKIFTAHLRTIIEDIYTVEFIQNLANNMQSHIEVYAESYPNILPELNSADYFQYNVENYLFISGGVYSDYCGITSTVQERREYLLGHSEITKVAPTILEVGAETISETEILITTEVTNSETVELMVKNQDAYIDFISVPMTDDGEGADVNSDDNIYSAIISSNNFGSGIKYYIRSINSEALVLSPKQAEWEFYNHYFSQQDLPDSTIVINEINYHSSDDSNSGDWVELHNPNSSMIALGGWKFKDESDDHIFSIPDSTVLHPSEFLVLCSDTNLFKNIYSDADNFIGNLNFGLSGSGELIRLFDENDYLIDSVLYNDEYPWETEPDGNGPTLELVNPLLDNSLAENWISSEGFGTPGFINSGYLTSKQKLVTISDFKVFNNYPNPFNPTTTISYELPHHAHVKVTIYNILGNLIKNLVDEEQSLGYKSIQWNATNNNGQQVSAGVYIYNVEVKNLSYTKKMVLVK